MNEDIMLKLPEVCKRLAVSRTAIYQLMERGELESVKIGRALRFRVSAVNELVSRGTRKEVNHAAHL